MPDRLILTAPLTGQTIPIEEIPDPVFASKMVGDGISIDPISDCLVAPCDGRITQIHPSHHAIAIKSPLGPEVLMHIGLDTVGLKGQGFKPLVALNDEVSQGTKLMEFDADLISMNAKSLMTEIVITNGEVVDHLEPHHGQAIAGETEILTIHLRKDYSKPQDKVAISDGDENFSYSPIIVIRNPQGLHARPAATLVDQAKRFQSNIEILKGTQSANCKSVMSIMALQVGFGDSIKLQASGQDREEAIKSLTVAIRGGLGEALSDMPKPTNSSPTHKAKPAYITPVLAPIVNGVYKGIAASPGLALGHVYQLRPHEYELPSEWGTPTEERLKLDRTIGQAQIELEHLQKSLANDADPEKAAIFAAHRQLLNDPDLVDNAHARILHGISAAHAWQDSYSIQADRLAALNQPLLAARATDVRDVGERVLRLLLGKTSDKPELPENTIIIAEDLTPTIAATLDRDKVLGFATVLGGGTSHVAILARSLDFPAIAGINPKALEIENGTLVLLDGNMGLLDTSLKDDDVQVVQKRIDEHKNLQNLYRQHAHEPAITSDGHRVEVVANIGSLADAKKAVELGAEGVGLLRSEFLFMGRNNPPSEEEQAHIYQDIAKTLGADKPLIIRTLDVGGDKPLSYLPIPKEDNPFLGERGIRVGLNHPDILRTQFRAILRASVTGKFMVMLPMISSLDEFRRAKDIFEEEKAALHVDDVPLGAMVEIPAAAVMAETLAKEAEFFSIGTNDLTQYTLAIDRGHPKLASQADGLNPAILRLIAMTVKGGHAHERMVGVCGGIAGDLQAVPILIGLGVDELSIAAPAIAAVKHTIRNLSYEKCQALAKQALGSETAARVRELLEAQR